MSNNTIIVKGFVEEFKDKNCPTLTLQECFELFSISQFAKDDNLSFEEIEDAIVDGSGDGGIDVFLIMIDNKYIWDDDDEIEALRDESKIDNLRVIIGQSKYQEKLEERVIDRFTASSELLFNLEATEQKLLERFRSGLVSKILIFQKVLQLSYIKGGKISIEFYYSSLANIADKMHSSFYSKIEGLKGLVSKKLSDVTVSFKLLSANELFEIYRKQKNRTSTLNFKETPMPIEYKGQRGYVGLVKLKDYYTFIVNPETQKLNEDFFENNIRHFQGNTPYNEPIKKTILSDFESDFWWLNNGVTIIASKVRGSKSLSMENVQIVNGLQTSYTIGRNYSQVPEEIADDRSVLVKIIDNENDETIDKVISATNRQNPVSAIMLRATDDIQRKIEAFFNKEGYFYDRRKNFYKNQGKPASKIFGIQTTAQAIHSIKNFEPTESTRPTSLIRNEKSYQKIFDEKVNFKIYLKCCLIFRKTYNYILSLNDKEVKGFSKLFKFHIARTVVSMVVSKYKYDSNDLLVFDESLLLTHSILDENIKLVYDCASQYRNQHNIPSLANIAKNKNFQEELEKKIKSLTLNSI